MFRHHECQNPSFISDSIGIPNGGEKNGKMSEEEEEERRRNLIHIEEDMKTSMLRSHYLT